MTGRAFLERDGASKRLTTGDRLGWIHERIGTRIEREAD
jgi:hypothetical protein